MGPASDPEGGKDPRGGQGPRGGTETVGLAGPAAAQAAWSEQDPRQARLRGLRRVPTAGAPSAGLTALRAARRAPRERGTVEIDREVGRPADVHDGLCPGDLVGPRRSRVRPASARDGIVTGHGNVARAQARRIGAVLVCCKPGLILAAGLLKGKETCSARWERASTARCSSDRLLAGSAAYCRRV